MSAEPHSHRFESMGCPCAFHVFGEPEQIQRFITRGLDEVYRFDQKYSRYRDDSVLSELNRRAAEPCLVDVETAALLDYAAACFAASGGLFDITTGIYRQIWRRGMSTLPTTNELTRCRERVGWKLVAWDGSTLQMRRGMELDFGGIVKEYAADALVVVARDEGITSGLIDLGGDLRVIGPNPDAQPWAVGIADPDNPASPVATTYLRDGAIATSGSYERYLVVDGRRYSHLIDPHSGWPVEGLRSVSVIAPQAVVAGSVATIASLQTADDGLRWLRALHVPFFAIDREGGVHSHAPRCAAEPLRPYW